jgi:SSS family solute:Na+ symporter
LKTKVQAAIMREEVPPATVGGCVVKARAVIACTISFFALCLAEATGGDWPRELCAYRGTTPKLDGGISLGEWDDATSFTGTKDWTPQFTPTTDDADLSLKGYVKYDDKRLYFAFDVTDDVLYGIDTDRWLPKENPKAHDLTREGYPWFGDEIELLINATNRWEGNQNAAGDGTSWQMVCNLTKSRQGGVGGLLEGEPRSKQQAWNTYQRWILTHDMEAVAKVKPGGKGYVIEWAVSFDPCLEVAPGVFFRPNSKEVRMGLNIALGDLDEKEKGEGNFGNFHHEDWFAGQRNTRTQLRQWGTLRLMPGFRPANAVQ